MKELIKWLSTLEKRAATVYRDASELFRDDEMIFNFTDKLAKEEDWHFDVISQLEDNTLLMEGSEGAISLDEGLKVQIEGYFIGLEGAIKKGDLSKEELLKCIAEAEFAEWNDIFLYAIMSCKGHCMECQKLASHMSRHKKEIEKFISATPYFNEELEKLFKLPPIWDNNILIVEDEAPIRDILQVILRKAGKTETAANGKEGLEKLRKKYFDLIISDVYMPEMDGMDMYNEAIKFDDDICKRIIFFTGASKSEANDFFKRNGLQHLAKPSNMKEIREISERVLSRPPSQ